MTSIVSIVKKDECECEEYPCLREVVSNGAIYLYHTRREATRVVRAGGGLSGNRGSVEFDDTIPFKGVLTIECK